LSKDAALGVSFARANRIFFAFDLAHLVAVLLVCAMLAFEVKQTSERALPMSALLPKGDILRGGVHAY
jgi:hypothetical protein